MKNYSYGLKKLKIIEQIAIVFFIAVVIPISISGFIINNIHQQSVRRQLRESNILVASMVSDEVDFFLKTNESTLAQIADTLEYLPNIKAKNKFIKDMVYRYPNCESILIVKNSNELEKISEDAHSNEKIILSTQMKNGEFLVIIFTAENWEHLEKRYSKISMEFSIDAVNEDTYKKLRGGDLAKLRKNMEFAGQLRAANKLNRLSISFVIQAANYREMEAFVEYGKSIHADYIHFMKLNSWGHIPEDDFIKMDVYDKRNVNHKAFVEILHNPIFSDSHVHVDNIGNFI